MKTNFNISEESITKIKLIFPTLGIGFFLLTFWLPTGITLGGDPYFLGSFLSELEIVLPLCTIGILLVLMVQILKKNFKISQSKWILISIFLAGEAILAFLSRDPQISILYLLLWVFAICGFGLQEIFHPEGKIKRLLFLVGILGGYGAMKFFPNLGVIPDLLAMAATLGTVFAYLEGKFKGRLVLILFYVLIIFESQNLGLILLFLATWLSAKFWLPRVQKSKNTSLFIFPIIFLIGLIIWGGIEGILTFEKISLSLKNLGQNMIWGTGEGQALIALQNLSDTFLSPENLKLPPYGILHTFLEKGIFGIILTSLLIFSPIIFRLKNGILFSLLFFGFWFFSSALLGTENGILFLGMFLLGLKEEKFRTRK